MSPKEGSRIPTPTDVVEISPDKKVNRRRSRLLAPILLGTALALGGGEGTKAQSPSISSQGDRVSFDAQLNDGWVDFGEGITFTDPYDRFNIDLFEDKDGNPITHKNIPPHLSELPYTNNYEQMQQGEPVNLYEIPHLEYPQELQKLVDEIKEKSGGVITFISPIDYRDIPGLGGEQNPEKPNFLPTIEYLRYISASFDNMPASLKRKKSTGINSVSEVVFLLNNPSNNIGGGNGMWTFEGTRFGTYSFILMNTNVPADTKYNEVLPKIIDRFLKTFWHEVAGHGHDRAERYATLSGDEERDLPKSQRIRYTHDVYDLQPDGTTWVLDPLERMVWCANPQIPSEGISDVYGGLLSRPQLFLLMGPRHQNHVAKEVKYGNFQDWNFLFSQQEVADRLQYLINLLPDTSPTPSPTKTTPESFTVFLPISHSGERVNATPEPEERFGIGRDLSDARRFIANYENRRNRKGR